jgi:hypothetical protein
LIISFFEAGRSSHNTIFQKTWLPVTYPINRN